MFFRVPDPAASEPVTVTSNSNRNQHASPIPWPVALTARPLANQHDVQVAGTEETPANRRQTQPASPMGAALPVRVSNSSAARPDVRPGASHRRPVEYL